jgi:hypothetical protein
MTGQSENAKGVARNPQSAVDFRLGPNSFDCSGRRGVPFAPGLMTGRRTMQHHDLVSDGFLAVTTAGILLLYSAVVALALS